MKKYIDFHGGNREMAVIHYKLNIEISESLYPCISVLEVALRNSINRELSKKFNTNEWYMHLHNEPGLYDLHKDINEAVSKILKRKEILTHDKIVAELTLGFWVRLFNAEYSFMLWKDLRRAFPYIPKKDKIRKNISAPLNRFRHLRNRIFHNEPISWNVSALRANHNEIINLLSWLNSDLKSFINELDRFSTVITKAESVL